MNDKISLTTAIVEAIRKCSVFSGGAAVLRTEEGEYVTTSPVNQQYYPNSEAVMVITNEHDVIGYDVDANEYTDEALAEYVDEIVIPDLDL